jgi:hypothetical protein
MDSLEFECPLCNGLFNAAATDVEVTCPHCDEKICLGSFEAVPSTNVILVAKPIVTPVPLFPPGYRNTTATDSSVSPTTVREESLPVVIIDNDVAKSVDDTESVTPPTTVREESLPVVIIDNDVAKSVDDTESVTPPTTVREESLPVVIIDDDLAKSVDDTVSVTPPTTMREESLPVVIIDDDVAKSVDDTESITPPTTVREESLPVVIIDDGVAESLVGTDTDTAIDDLLPPGFQLDDVQIERDTELHETTEATVVIDVRVDREPLTVGRGINERELRNRTPDEKNQFMRKKNVIVWGIGALIIIVTMIVMLQLS